MTRRIGRALNGEPRGCNSPSQAIENLRKDFKNNGNCNADFQGVRGSDKSFNCFNSLNPHSLTFSHLFHFADEKTEAMIG